MEQTEKRDWLPSPQDVYNVVCIFHTGEAWATSERVFWWKKKSTHHTIPHHSWNERNTTHAKLALETAFFAVFFLVPILRTTEKIVELFEHQLYSCPSNDSDIICMSLLLFGVFAFDECRYTNKHHSSDKYTNAHTHTHTRRERKREK